MFENREFKLFTLPGSVGLLLWIILLLLTSAILIFPVNLEFEYNAVESLYIFGEYLWLFGIIFILWMAVLLVLLLSRIGEWQRVLLVGIFAVVFFGFWVIIAPYGGWCDGLVNMGHVEYLSKTGIIPFDHNNLAYFQYPGIPLMGFALSETLGVEILEIRTLFLVFCRVLFAILLYMLFSRSLKNPSIASLSVIILAFGSMLIIRTTFHAAVTAIILFVIMLYFLLKYGSLAKPAIISLCIICFASLTITYLPIPIYFIFILGGIYIFDKINKRKTINFTMFILCSVIFLIWEMFWATRFFGSLAEHIESFLAAFSNPLERLLPIFNTATVKLGEQIPLWTSLTRYFWLIFVYLFGIFLAIRNIFRVKKLDSIEFVETGGLWGVLVLSGIIVFAFYEGTQWHRLLMYTPFFTIPLIIKYLTLSRSPRHLKSTEKIFTLPYKQTSRLAIFIISVFLIILSLPTFLVNQSGITTQSVYEYEIATGEFVRENYDEKSLLFISDSVTVYSFSYYIPDAELSHPKLPWEIADEDELWLSFQSRIDRFYSYKHPAIFAITERYGQAYISTMPIENSDPEWIDFIDKLAPSDMIYNNGHTQMFVNQPK